MLLLDSFVRLTVEPKTVVYDGDLRTIELFGFGIIFRDGESLHPVRVVRVRGRRRKVTEAPGFDPPFGLTHLGFAGERHAVRVT